MKEFGLLGAGGQADEAAEYALPERPLFRAVSHEYLVPGQVGLIDLATRDVQLLDTPVAAAVGAPGMRRDLIEAWGGSRYATIVSTHAWIANTAQIDVGCIVAAFASVSTNARLGKHVLVNLGVSVSHDVEVGDFTTISPGGRIGGRVKLGAGVFIGIGASVSNDVTIVPGVVVGAGAVVVSDIDVPGVYVGIPARRLKAQEGWLRVI